ncbi:MAG: CPBP family intramembrane glutamic endopeptidase [Candidatus Saccharibacteria bacterium]|nr:CPBP family intramembrane glutamic endopeptidase [Candidatus Saccharibacteria bacterium]
MTDNDHEQQSVAEKPKTPFLGLTPNLSLFGTFAVYISAQILSLVVVGGYAALRFGSSDQAQRWLQSNQYALFAMSLLTALLGTALIGLILRWTKTNWRSIGLKRPQLKDGLNALLGYGYYFPLFIVTSVAVYNFLPGVDFQQEQQLGFDRAVSGWPLLVVFVGLVVLPPLYEEILCRGFLYTGLRRRMNMWVAGFITSVVFAAAHLGFGSGDPLHWAVAIDTFVLSIVLVGLREKTGSLWPAIGLHAIKNMIAFSLLFIFRIF